MIKQNPNPFKRDIMLCNEVYNELRVFNQPIVSAVVAFEMLGRISKTNDLQGAELYRALVDRYILSGSTLDISNKDPLHWKLYLGTNHESSDLLSMIGMYQLDDYDNLDFLRVVGAETHIDNFLELFHFTRVRDHIRDDGTVISINTMSRFIGGKKCNRIPC